MSIATQQSAPDPAMYDSIKWPFSLFNPIGRNTPGVHFDGRYVHANVEQLQSSVNMSFGGDSAGGVRDEEAEYEIVQPAAILHPVRKVSLATYNDPVRRADRERHALSAFYKQLGLTCSIGTAPASGIGTELQEIYALLADHAVSTDINNPGSCESTPGTPTDLSATHIWTNTAATALAFEANMAEGFGYINSKCRNDDTLQAAMVTKNDIYPDNNLAVFIDSRPLSECVSLQGKDNAVAGEFGISLGERAAKKNIALVPVTGFDATYASSGGAGTGDTYITLLANGPKFAHMYFEVLDGGSWIRDPDSGGYNYHLAARVAMLVTPIMNTSGQWVKPTCTLRVAME
jgi:hypothetical protein